MKTKLPGKDAYLEDTIEEMTAKLKGIGIEIEITSWLNPVPHVWSVHLRDKESPMCFTNGKGATKNAAHASALGEYFERLSCNYFYADWFFGKEVSTSDFAHYPNEKWFKIAGDSLPEELMDKNLKSFYNPEGHLTMSHLIDTNSGQKDRGVCALPFVRQSDEQTVYIPVNIIGNLYVSNGMSAGNTKPEARVQCLSEIFERYVKNKIIKEEISLPQIPQEVLNRYPQICEGIQKLEEEGFPVVVCDASLGGKFPVINVTLMNPQNGGVFASFGAHPRFEVALERTLTELLQGRKLDSLDVVQKPTFNEFAVGNNENLENHFIDSTGVISWKFFSEKSDYSFSDWNFSGSTQQEYDHLMDIFKQMEKEVYIADFNHLGVNACRILVPGMSEIYSVEDLLDDNNNRALDFRQDILNLRNLSDDNCDKLFTKLEESGLDDFMPISELIGVVFDKDSGWFEYSIGELKAALCLAIGNLESAKEMIEMFMNFAEKDSKIMNYYRTLNSMIDIELDDELNFNDYKIAFNKLYSEQTTTDAQRVIRQEEKFYGLEDIDSSLKGLKTHQALVTSLKKLRKQMLS